MKVKVNGLLLDLQESDEVEIARHICGKCNTTHEEISIHRNITRIAHFGDYVSLKGGDEIFGGTLLNDKGIPLPDLIWKIHIVKGMTPDKLYYQGFCGEVLNHSDKNKNDQIAFSLRDITAKEKSRICQGCLQNLKQGGKK